MLGIKLNFATIAQLGLAAATGGASLAVMAQQMIVKAAVQMAIQQACQQLGLPPAVASMAMAAFNNGAGLDAANGLSNSAGGMQEMIGQFGEQFNLSPSEMGMLARTGTEAANSLTDTLTQLVNEGLKSSNKETKRKPMGPRAGQSLLVAIATMMGEIMDQKLNKMYKLTTELGGLDTKNSQYGAKTGELQAVGKELDFVSQAMNNTIKSIGDAASTIARKN